MLTGFVTAPPVVDEARPAGCATRARDVDLASSFGYGDSQSDVTWLALLGKPFAVDPDLGPYEESQRNRWPILEWR